jgi:Outer membrane protein beta-barrel domain
MKKLLVLAFLFYGKMTYAQMTGNHSFKYFGFQTGVNMSNMNFNLGSTAPDTHIELSWKPGIAFGFILQIPLAKNLSLQPEYSFVRRNGSDRSTGIDYTLDFLSMPVLLNYQVSRRFALLAGPQVELLINAQSTYKGGDNNITHDVEERSIGFLAGLEFQIIKSLFLSARYFQGLNNIGIGQRSDVKEFKYQVFNINAGIRF